ncbi:hypothetical protein SIID45300_01246 [Candidatus Magnetaquicoccaceae bacterium FCR-1]|uniref:Uncharacterized protein n=1 Tax=Candidatus Magnetaquiglobus chichijimensis TaxID=3141448 RepID=A0ABQ0C7S6_9PROT
MENDWIALPRERRAIHRPTGLILEFKANTDGSGSMRVDSPNPQVLPESWLANAEALVREGWLAYASASEVALTEEWAAEAEQTSKPVTPA